MFRSEVKPESWNTICAAWKAATTILVLRYLYFGRPELTPQVHGRSTPLLATQAGALFAPPEELSAYYQSVEDSNLGEMVDDSADAENIPDYLTAGLYVDDPLSRSPSPLPSPMHYSEPPTSKIWDTRYDIHDEAFAALATSLTALHDNMDPVCLRYILVPVLVLALISRPQSQERALCMSFLAKYKSFMAHSAPSPIGGEELDFEIPWEELDAYSEMIERERRDSVVSTNAAMAKSAPEWNWWDMLKHIDFNMACKCAGHGILRAIGRKQIQS